MFCQPLIALFAMVPLVLSAPAASTASTSNVDFKSSSSIQKSTFPTLAARIPQNCPVSNITVPLSSVAGLSVPSGQVVSAIAVGRGVQNYTCSNGTYASAGALANLFDVSCLYTLTSGFIDPNTISGLLPKMAFSALSFPDAGSKIPLAIHHQFVATPGSTTKGAISPEFSTGSDHVILSKIAGVNAPSDSTTNVPWLQLGALEGQGTLSKSVFRTNTFKGQPPTSCTAEGEPLSVQYATMYFFTE
ncbi:hypothetical protein I302_101664 [Kwoniella bestiolae CBS 10118]|uniref:Malate dehydrogenase n=1 Tax=Kwoniella bestiolae CBS 10118 TaxID=1296100 RepID=A0A1B9GCV6_9TREE|nr:hypothetical protein I302_00341 [Kwoniella bestiolae CBS 10118]OCF28851.1 hypothetical protein I302_00341 [Kwoniella bestiolae CBS 10118]